MRKILALLVVLLVLCACRRHAVVGMSQGGDTIRLAYADLLCMTEQADSQLLHITVSDPWHQGKTLQRLTLSGDTTAQGVMHPLKRVVVFTTSHCQLLEYLGLADRIVGVCDLQYILIPDIQQRVRAGKIANCGNSMSPDLEKIVSLHPDAILLSPFEGGDYGRLEKLGIPIILAADYMESSSLGRAEWMRYYGRLFGCGQKADSLFKAVDASYGRLKAQAARLPQGRSILTERKTGATWYTPGGESTIGVTIRDAHGSYAFADDRHSGSLPLSFEQIIAKAGESDVWAFKFNGSHMMSRQDLLNEFHGYEALKAFRTGEIYECNCSKVPYFEEVSWRPDYLLRELMILLHPQLKMGALRYYKKLSE